jgi:hypothetical protein
LTKSRRLVFVSSHTQCAIGKKAQQIIVSQPHRLVCPLIRIGYTSCFLAEARAKRPHGIGIADSDEAHRDSLRFKRPFNLAQLREWFAEKRSTDVAKPNDQSRQRNTKLSDFRRHIRTKHAQRVRRL